MDRKLEVKSCEGRMVVNCWSCLLIVRKLFLYFLRGLVVDIFCFFYFLWSCMINFDELSMIVRCNLKRSSWRVREAVDF